MSDPFYDALGKEVARTMNMGVPVKPPIHDVKDTSGNSQAKPKAIATKSDAPRLTCGGGVLVDLHASKVPMKWAIGGGANTTTYLV